MGSAISTFRLSAEFPLRVKQYPKLRYMGSKFRLLPWIFEILSGLDFDTALDVFSGSGCVAYLLKAMGKQVCANDFLRFSSVIAKTTIENPGRQLDGGDLDMLWSYDPKHPHFIEKTFGGIFFTPDDLRFLDRMRWNVRKLVDPHKQAIAMAAMIRSCVKRQPRGVFTVAGDPDHYKDGRRDLKLSLREHFAEQVDAYNRASFDNGRDNRALRGDVFDLDPRGVDLVYMDPPYVPRSDDNCYVKRYHFLEGLACYWEGVEILENTRVKKIKKPYTPFSYRKDAAVAFERMFQLFAKSILVLSYSSNGYPDLDILLAMMRNHKDSVTVFEREHRYHFGTHKAAVRNKVREFLIVGV